MSDQATSQSSTIGNRFFLSTFKSKVEYEYDSSGRRISKSVNGIVTKYVYGGSQVLCEYAVFGDTERLIRKYVYGPGIDEPIRMTSYTAKADFNNDGIVDATDAGLLGTVWLYISTDAGFVADYDLSGDGRINNADTDILAAGFKTSGVQSQKDYYYHFDGTGNVIGVLDSGGDFAEIYRYGPYGQFAIYAPDGSKQDESVCGNDKGNLY